MPGELFIEYQLAAEKMRPDATVCMAAYGDYGPGYIGTEIAYTQGGYETGPVSRVRARGGRSVDGRDAGVVEMSRNQFGMRNAEFGNDMNMSVRRASDPHSASRITHWRWSSLLSSPRSSHAPARQDTSAGDKVLAEYLQQKTAKLAERRMPRRYQNA